MQKQEAHRMRIAGFITKIWLDKSFPFGEKYDRVLLPGSVPIWINKDDDDRVVLEGSEEERELNRVYYRNVTERAAQIRLEQYYTETKNELD